MKKTMTMLTIISLIGLSVSGTIYYFTRGSIFFSIAITFGTMLYHFAMRLMVGFLIDAKYHNRMDYTKSGLLNRTLKVSFISKSK